MHRTSSRQEEARAPSEPGLSGSSAGGSSAGGGSPADSSGSAGGVAPLRILLCFAGAAETEHALPRQLRGAGHLVTAIDTRLGGAAHDVQRGGLGRRLEQAVLRGDFDVVFLAPPCSSFSVRHPVRLRSDARPDGVQPLPRGWEAYVAKHNALADFTADMVTACQLAQVPCAVENPASRSDRGSPAYWEAHADAGSIWKMPRLSRALQAADARRHTFAQCAPAIGGKAQKYTTIAATGALRSELTELDSCRCEHGGRGHAERLEGVDASGRSRATAAAAYPRGLNIILAGAIIRAGLRARAMRAAAQEDDAWCVAPAQGSGRLADGPALCPALAAACTAASELEIGFASPRRLTAAPRAEIRATAMPCDPSAGMCAGTRPRSRQRVMHRRRLRRMPARPASAGSRRGGEEDDGAGVCGECEEEAPLGMQWAERSAAACRAGGPAAALIRMAQGPIHISDLYLPGVYTEVVQGWLAQADAAAAAIRRGEAPPAVPTVTIGQEQMAPWARGMVWDCADPANCRPVQRSSGDTTSPGERQLDRAAVRRIADELGWHDEDIIRQIGGGGIETRSECELITVLAFHHGSLLAEIGAAEATVRTHLQEEWVSPAARHLPFVPCRLQPRGVVLQPRSRVLPDGTLEDYMKPRVTTDGSFGGPDSVNASVPDGERGVSLPSAQTLGVGWAVCQSAFDGADATEGGGTQVAGYCVDAESAYSFCPVQHADLWTQAFCWWDEDGVAGFHVDRRMGFGGAFAPNRFERVSTFVAAYAQHLQAEFDAQQPPPVCAQRWSADRRAMQQAGRLPSGEAQLHPRYLQVFIDDFTGCAGTDRVVPPRLAEGVDIGTSHMEAAGCRPPPRDTRAFVHAQLTVMALRRFGLVAAPHKVVIGSPLPALGLLFDGERRLIACPEGKRAVATAACAAALARLEADGEGGGEVEQGSAARLVGRLCGLAQVCPSLRPLLQGGYAVTQASWAGRRSGRLQLREGSRAWRGWSALLEGAPVALSSCEGVAMAPQTLMPGRAAAGSLTVVADASGDDGAGGFAWMAGAPDIAVVVSEPWPEDIRAALAASADEREAQLRRSAPDQAQPFLPTAAAELFTQLLVARVASRVLGQPARVYGVCDCSAAVRAIDEMHGRSPHMAAVAGRVAASGWTWVGVDVPREFNFDADRLSHPHLVGTVMQEAADAGVRSVHLRAEDSDWALLREAVAEAGVGDGRKRRRRAVSSRWRQAAQAGTQDQADCGESPGLSGQGRPRRKPESIGLGQHHERASLMVGQGPTGAVGR